MRENKVLMESKEDILIHRAQGSVGIIDLIKEIPQDLKQYLKDVTSGKIQPLKEE